MPRLNSDYLAVRHINSNRDYRGAQLRKPKALQVSKLPQCYWPGCSEKARCYDWMCESHWNVFCKEYQDMFRQIPQSMRGKFTHPKLNKLMRFVCKRNRTFRWRYGELYTTDMMRGDLVMFKPKCKSLKRKPRYAQRLFSIVAIHERGKLELIPVSYTARVRKTDVLVEKYDALDMIVVRDVKSKPVEKHMAVKGAYELVIKGQK